MKKIIASVAMGLTIVGTAVTTASAEEYVVQKGDSLWEIAEANDTSVENLVALNDLNTTVIQPKQILSIDETYIVEKGDTLYNLAKKYNVTVDDLIKWNHLDTKIIKIGQELTIKNGSFTIENTSQHTPVEKNREHKSEENVSQSEPKEIIQNAPEGKEITVKATAYTADCEGCSGITATGIDLHANRSAKVIAVDPNVIPLGSKVYVEGYGQAIAGDTGGAIKGNRIDIHVPTKDAAKQWGVRNVSITIIGN